MFVCPFFYSGSNFALKDLYRYSLMSNAQITEINDFVSKELLCNFNAGWMAGISVSLFYQPFYLASLKYKHQLEMFSSTVDALRSAVKEVVLQLCERFVITNLHLMVRTAIYFAVYDTIMDQLHGNQLHTPLDFS
jgi:hypothetical protein